MRYCDGEAIGLIETVGMVPAIYGMDRMLKAADVQLIAYENIGSTLVTVMVKGDVAAVQAAVATGAKAAASIGTLTAHHVMPRPVRGIGQIVSIHGVDATPSLAHPVSALGFIETFGIVFALEAADAMEKAAGIELIGYENVASGYISILVQGDVAACQAAVAAGIAAVERMEASVYSSIVIPAPHASVIHIAKQYFLENILP